MFVAIMLPKNITGKKNLVFLEVGHHGIGPVKVGSSNKPEDFVSQIEGLTIFDHQITKLEAGKVFHQLDDLKLLAAWYRMAFPLPTTVALGARSSNRATHPEWSGSV